MSDQQQASTYEIHIQGHLDAGRARHFEEMAVVRLPDGTTLLTGALVDQAALYGVLSRIRDLGITLLAVQRIDLQGGTFDESI